MFQGFDVVVTVPCPQSRWCLRPHRTKNDVGAHAMKVSFCPTLLIVPVTYSGRSRLHSPHSLGVFHRSHAMNGTTERPAWFLLTRHWLSLAGIALLATAIISWLFVLPLQIRGHVDNPYVGIVIFLILP